jgi:hypothetical protein
MLVAAKTESLDVCFRRFKEDGGREERKPANYASFERFPHLRMNPFCNLIACHYMRQRPSIPPMKHSGLLLEPPLHIATPPFSCSSRKHRIGSLPLEIAILAQKAGKAYSIGRTSIAGILTSCHHILDISPSTMNETTSLDEAGTSALKADDSIAAKETGSDHPSSHTCHEPQQVDLSVSGRLFVQWQAPIYVEYDPEDPQSQELIPTFRGGFDDNPPFRMHTYDSSAKRKRIHNIPPFHNRIILHPGYKMRIAKRCRRTSLELVRNLKAFLVSEYRLSIEEAAILANVQVTVSRAGPLRVADFIWPEDGLSLSKFNPKIDGESAYWAGCGTYTAEHYATIGFQGATGISNPGIVDIFSAAFAPHAKILELWNVLIYKSPTEQDPRDPSRDILTGEYHFLVELYDQNGRLALDPSESLSKLPGFVNIDYDEVELFYLHRFDHCTFCKSLAFHRHTRNECPIHPMIGTIMLSLPTSLDEF